MLCTDNRLMSNTSLSKEMGLAVEYYGLDIRDLEKLSINAMKSAFIGYNERIELIYDVLKPRFAQLRETINPNM